MTSNEFRFGVGNPSGRRSPSWKVVFENTEDIYVIHREAKDGFKISFHRDNKNHVAINLKTWQEEMHVPGLDKPSRYYEKWSAKFSIAENEQRLSALFHVIVASQDLQYYDTVTKHENDDVMWFSDPGDGMQFEVALFRGPIPGDGALPAHRSYNTEQAQWLDKQDVRLWIVGYARPVTCLSNEPALVRAIRKRGELAGRPMEDIADDSTIFVGIRGDEGIPGIRIFSGRSIRAMLSPSPSRSWPNCSRSAVK